MKSLTVLLVCMIFFGAVQSGVAQEIVRLTNGEWPPYLSENLEHYGIASRIVTEAFAVEGIQVEYGFFPWNRSLELAKSGEWDGAVVWKFSEERAQSFYFSEPVISTQWVFFHLKTHPFEWNTVEDLAEYRIGGVLGYFYGDTFQEAEKAGKIQIYRIGDDSHNFKLLLNERIDIYPQDATVGYSMIHEMFPEEDAQRFTHHPLPLTTEPLFLLLSKANERNKALVEIFNRGLRRLKESGKIEQYLAESLQGTNTTK